LYVDQELYSQAINAYDQALRILPDLAVAHNNLAWLYATCDDPKFRDSKAALAHAERAVELTNWKEGQFIDTLAEAHYANGDFEQAVEIQKRALALLPDDEELKEHMARYKRATNI
jgi:tetratricopeptide (TPR) repeat protein